MTFLIHRYTWPLREAIMNQRKYSKRKGASHQRMKDLAFEAVTILIAIGRLVAIVFYFWQGDGHFILFS